MSRKFFPIVLILAVIVSGYYVYDKYIAGQKNTYDPATVTEAGAFKVLPYGNSLDFKAIGQYNPSSRTFTYQTVNQSEVGIPFDDLFKQPSKK